MADCTSGVLANRVAWSPGSIGWRLLFSQVDRRLTADRLAVLEAMRADLWFRDRLDRQPVDLTADDRETITFTFADLNPQLFDRLADALEEDGDE